MCGHRLIRFQLAGIWQLPCTTTFVLVGGMWLLNVPRKIASASCTTSLAGAVCSSMPDEQVGGMHDIAVSVKLATCRFKLMYVSAGSLIATPAGNTSGSVWMPPAYSIWMSVFVASHSY